MKTIKVRIRAKNSSNGKNSQPQIASAPVRKNTEHSDEAIRLNEIAQAAINRAHEVSTESESIKAACPLSHEILTRAELSIRDAMSHIELVSDQVLALQTATLALLRRTDEGTGCSTHPDRYNRIEHGLEQLWGMIDDVFTLYVDDNLTKAKKGIREVIHRTAPAAPAPATT